MASSKSQGKVFSLSSPNLSDHCNKLPNHKLVLCKSLTKQVFYCRALTYVCTTAVLHTMLQLRSEKHEGVRPVVTKIGGDRSTDEFSKKGSLLKKVLQHVRQEI